MNRSLFAALLVALPLCTTAVSTTAVAATAPQYQLVDLGNTGYAGEGSQWRTTSGGALTQQWTVLSTTCSLGGSNAVSLPEYLGSGYAVGSSCLPGGGQHACRLSFPPKSAPTFGLTDLGALPGALPDPGLGIQSEAVGFNQAGDIVGTS